jgi:hypothetical protein
MYMTEKGHQQKKRPRHPSASLGEDGPELVTLPKGVSVIPVSFILKGKLAQIGYPDFEVRPGEEHVPMLYINNQLICSVQYATAMEERDLLALIEETVKGGA